MVMSVKLNRISKTKYFYNRTEESILYLKHLKALGGEGGVGGGRQCPLRPSAATALGTEGLKCSRAQIFMALLKNPRNPQKMIQANQSP